MKYVCETCNKVFGTHEEAEACEKEHELQREAHAVAKDEEKAISEAVSAFIVKHKCKPCFTLTEEAGAVLTNCTADRLIKYIVDLLG